MKFDLEERLIDFGVLIIHTSDKVKRTDAGIALTKQIVRSGTSPALNYGEAQAAESQKDFIHKFKLVLKELRETYVCLKMISKANLAYDKELIEKALAENNELIAIFVKSIITAKSKVTNRN